MLKSEEIIASVLKEAVPVYVPPKAKDAPSGPSWLDKIVTNPETGNKVKVKSLSPEHQKKYRPGGAGERLKSDALEEIDAILEKAVGKGKKKLTLMDKAKLKGIEMLYATPGLGEKIKDLKQEKGFN